VSRTAWHITFGTYGDRLHGDARKTIERAHKERGDAVVGYDKAKLERARANLRYPPVRLTHGQREFVEQAAKGICERGGWSLHTCAAATNHIHVLLDADALVHGKHVRAILKRWLTQALNERWPREGAWWAEGGSTKAVRCDAYFRNVEQYISVQRTTR